MEKRIAKFGLADAGFAYKAFPTRYWDVFGKKGTPIRATVSEMGPLLFSRILGLNDTQEGILNIIFKIADDQNLMLLDLKDLKAMVQFVGDNAASYRTSYGNISTASIGAIQRGILTLQQQGAEDFFGEPALDIKDWLQCDTDGRGFINDMTDKEEIRIETRCGIKTLKLKTENGKVKEARVDMGAPILEAEKIPIVSENERVISEPIVAAGLTYRMTGVSMGNPHAVVFLSENPEHFPLEAVGPVFEHHERFPDRINTEFAFVLNEHEIRMRVWERGSGETLACGTGACATGVAGILNGFVKSPVTVHLTGGDLTIEWDGEGKSVFMTGPAAEVFEGEINV